MPKLDDILLRKKRRKARLESSLDSIISQLKSLGALKIILFGSLARGEVDMYSDLRYVRSYATHQKWKRMDEVGL